MRSYLQQHPDALDVEPYGTRSGVITSETEPLRKFVQQHQDTPGAFAKPVTLRRKS